MAEFVDKISKMKSFRSRKPASMEQIENAEGELGLTFSNEYKQYLLAYGAASVFGHEFTGISSNGRISVVDVTFEEREFNDIRDDLYVVEQIHMDGIVIWQDSKGAVYKSDGQGNCKYFCESLSEYVALEY